MLHTKILVSGTLSQTRYTMDNPGDKVIGHAHGRKDVHVTIVTNGRLRVWLAHPANPIDLVPGDHIEFHPGQWHELEAVAPNTRIFNIPYN